jgi:hypothetical protein
MPARRTPIRRELRRPKFTLDTLRLFIELEAMTDQDSKEYHDKSKVLANMLGLGDAWLCSSVDVCTRELEPCWPPDHPACDDFWRVRAIRLQLIAAITAVNGHGYHYRPSADDRRSTISNHTTTNDISDHTITLAAAAAHRPGEP